MWKGKGRSGYGESSTLGDYDDWSCLSRNGKQWKNPITMQTRDLSGADYWHMRKQLTDSYDVPEELHAVNETVSLAHVLPSGKANLAAYGDPVVVRKPISKVSIKDKILPQLKRLSVLRDQMFELETSYRAGEMNISEYSLLRDIIVTKIQRQEVLYKRAASVKPKSSETDEDSALVQAEYTPSSGFSPQPNDGYASEEYEDCGVEFIDELSSNNSFKKPLKIACTLIKTALHWSHKARSYWNELKAV
jgi:hypothetical protein